MSAMEKAMMRRKSQSPGRASGGRAVARQASSEQASAEMSPASVRDRVLAPKRYNAPVSKLGDARACMSPHRNNEKMFGFFSDHPGQEYSPHRQSSRENLYRSHTPPPVPRRVRSTSAGRPRTADSASQYSGSSSFRDGSVSDRSSLLSGRWSASRSPPRSRGSAKWAVPGHGHMALWGNVTQPHVSPGASWRQSWTSGRAARPSDGASDRMSETGSVAFSSSMRSFSTLGRAPSEYGDGDYPDRDKQTESHSLNDTCNLSASMRRSLKKAVRQPSKTNGSSIITYYHYHCSSCCCCRRRRRCYYYYYYYYSLGCASTPSDFPLPGAAH